MDRLVHNLLLALLLLLTAPVFPQLTRTRTTCKVGNITEQKPTPSGESKYPTPCIKSFICNNGEKTPNGIHFGDCWCCIFKQNCYSSKFICTVKCLFESRLIKNETSSAP